MDEKQCPWQDIKWDERGGRGRTPYPTNLEMTTIKVPKHIARLTKQYAIWLSHQHLPIE